MGGTCGTHGGEERYIQGFSEETWGKETIRKTRAQWDGNEMDIKEVGCGGMDWIYLAEDMGRWRALVNAVMNLRVP